MNKFDDVGSHQDAIALFEASLGDFFAIHERPVRTAEILNLNLAGERSYPCVTSRHHVLNEDHIKVTGSSNHDLRIHL